MHLGDCILVFVAFCFSIFCWYQEGSVSFRLAFVTAPPPFSSESFDAGPVKGLEVKPLLVELRDGTRGIVEARGKRIFLYLTSDLSGAGGEGSEVSLPPSFSVRLSNRIVGTAAGYITPASKASTSSAKNAADASKSNNRSGGGEGNNSGVEDELMIAVMDEHYTLYLIAVPPPHKRRRVISRAIPSLAVQWEKTIAPPALQWPSLYTASLSVLQERVYDDDTGMVVMSVPIKNSDGLPGRLFVGTNGGDGGLRWEFLGDAPGEREAVLHEVNDEDLKRSGESEYDPAAPTGKTSDESEAKRGSEEAEDRDFSFLPRFAFEDPQASASRSSGGANTTSEPGIYTVGGSERIQFQGSTMGRNQRFQMYEKPWTQYRESVVSALPHFYHHRWDERLVPHVLYHTRASDIAASRDHSTAASSSRRGRGGKDGSKNKKNDDDQPQTSKQPRRRSSSSGKERIQMPSDEYGVLGDVMKRKPWTPRRDLPVLQDREHRRTPNCLVFHGKNLMVLLHLYSGYTLTRVAPLPQNSFFTDVNGDLMIEAVANRIGVSTEVFGQLGVNTGMECTGVIRTGLPSSQHIMVNHTVCDTPGLFGTPNMIHRLLRGDNAASQVFAHTVNKLELLGSYNSVSFESFAVMPLVVQVGQNGIDTRPEPRAIFMVNSGLVTCVDPIRNRVAWRASSRSSFTREASDDEQGYPHLIGYSISAPRPEDDMHYVGGGGSQQHERIEQYVLAVGDKSLTVLHAKSGATVQQLVLPHPPLGPLLVADFNGDEVSDVLVVTRQGIYGFEGAVQTNNAGVATLLFTSICSLLILFFTRDANLWPLSSGGGADSGYWRSGSREVPREEEDDAAEFDHHYSMTQAMEAPVIVSTTE